MAKKKEPLTLKNTVTYDTLTKKFTQKGHLVHGDKVLKYPIGICEYPPCSKKYPKHRKKQRFCCTPCRMKWWIRQQHDGKDPDYGEAICPIDGVVFKKTRPWSKYCSTPCQDEGRKRITAEARRQELLQEPEVKEPKVKKPRLPEVKLTEEDKRQVLEKFSELMSREPIRVKEILNDRELKVLGLRITGLTLENIGVQFALSRERVRQIEELAINKLRNRITAENRQREKVAEPG